MEDIVNKLDKIINEASGTSGSTEMGFMGWWNRANHVFYNTNTNEVLHSGNTRFPIGSTLDDAAFTLAKESGITLIPRQ
jgi:hypothetical protein